MNNADFNEREGGGRAGRGEGVSAKRKLEGQAQLIRVIRDALFLFYFLPFFFVYVQPFAYNISSRRVYMDVASMRGGRDQCVPVDIKIELLSAR